MSYLEILGIFSIKFIIVVLDLVRKIICPQICHVFLYSLPIPEAHPKLDSFLLFYCRKKDNFITGRPSTANDLKSLMFNDLVILAWRQHCCKTSHTVDGTFSNNFDLISQPFLAVCANCLQLL